jgi:hypothetical protein
MAEALLPFWATPLDDELRALDGTRQGLTQRAARQRRARSARSRLAPPSGTNALLYALASELAKRVFYRHAAL